MVFQCSNSIRVLGNFVNSEGTDVFKWCKLLLISILFSSDIFKILLSWTQNSNRRFITLKNTIVLILIGSCIRGLSQSLWYSILLLFLIVAFVRIGAVVFKK